MRTMMLGLVGASLLVGLGGVASASIYEDFTTGKFFEPVAVPNGITWDAANTAATLAGGYLAIIHDAAENNFVFSLIDSSEYWSGPQKFGDIVGPWLGAIRQDDAHQWHWAHDGSPLLYANWYPQQPDYYGGYPDAVQYYAGSSSMGNTWGDAPGNGVSGLNAGLNYLSDGYVIEFDTAPVPEPATLIIWSLLGAGSWLGTRVWQQRRGPVSRQPWSPENRQAIRKIVARASHRGK